MAINVTVQYNGGFLPDILLFDSMALLSYWYIIAIITTPRYCFVKKNLNASKPSEHPPSGEKCLKA